MSACPVDVWTFSLEIPRPPILSPEEQSRAARFRFEHDRIHWANARTALRLILASYLPVRPDAIQFDYGPNGKPTTPGIEFNISHAGSWAMIAVTHGVPVGIDIEMIRDVEIASLLRRIGETDLPQTVAELFQTWTRRESKTKALGGQLMHAPTADLRVVDLKAPDGYAASLALLEADPVVSYRTRCSEPVRE